MLSTAVCLMLLPSATTPVNVLYVRSTLNCSASLSKALSGLVSEGESEWALVRTTSELIPSFLSSRTSAFGMRPNTPIEPVTVTGEAMIFLAAAEI